jgi:hypothetical protein
MKDWSLPDIAQVGFEKFELGVLLPSWEPPMSEGLQQTQTEVAGLIEDMDAKKKKQREQRKKINADMDKRTAEKRPEMSDADLFIVLVFPDRSASDQFLDFLSLPITEKYIDGALVFDKLKEALAVSSRNETSEDEHTYPAGVVDAG